VVVVVGCGCDLAVGGDGDWSGGDVLMDMVMGVVVLSLNGDGDGDEYGGRGVRAMKGLVEALLKRATSSIQVKSITKEFEDYLKTYSSAGMDNSCDNTNNTGTKTVALNVVIEDLPQLLGFRGGSYVTNVPKFDVEDFTSWKDRFLVYLDALKGEKVQGTFTRLKILLNDLENKVSLFLKLRRYNYEEGMIDQIYESETSRCTIQGFSSKALISNTHCQDSDSDVEEDTRSSSEVLVDLNVEFYDKALLANQKRFYKISGRVGSARKPMDKSNETCFACGK
nr:hypothetical protein [Tanacetum cinerariifolium]